MDGAENILIAMCIGQRQQHDFIATVMQFPECSHDVINLGFRDETVAVEHRIML